MNNIIIITASHNSVTLESNLKNSPILKEDKASLIVADDFANVSKSYNKANELLKFIGQDYEYFMYAHEDVYLPATFENDFKQALKLLPDDWEVLGLAGVRYENGGRTMHGHINDRGKIWGKEIKAPVKVQTVDELMVITRKPLMFDEQFDLDFYGADLCMQANAKGNGVYVVPGFVHHNSSRAFGGRTPSFYVNLERFKTKWEKHLPIATTCTIVK